MHKTQLKRHVASGTASTVTLVLQVQKPGRADAALAAWNVCHDIAAGIDTQRCLKLAGPGCHHRIAAATRIQQAKRSSKLGQGRPVDVMLTWGRGPISSPGQVLDLAGGHGRN